MQDTILNLWRSTPQETTSATVLKGNISCDVVIIGAGFTGVSAALHLAESGINVAVVEANTLGHGGSGRNVGLVNAGMWTSPDKVEALVGKAEGSRLNTALAAGPQLVFDLIKKHRIHCEAEHNGTLHCAHSASGLRDLNSRFQQYTSRGAQVEMLTAAESARRTGTTAFLGALWDARAGSIQPLSYVRGLARAAISAGARFFENSPVISADHHHDQWTVTTPQGNIIAPRLIQASNAYGTKGLYNNPFIPLYYFQMATKPLNRETRKEILPENESCWDTALVLSSFRLDSQNRMLIGGIGNLESIGASIHHAWAKRKLKQIYPQLAKVPFEHAWSGRMALTKDNLPKIVKIGKNAISIFGYNGRGIGPGSVFGKCTVDWIKNDNEDAFPVPIRNDYEERFEKTKSMILETGATLTHLVKAWN